MYLLTCLTFTGRHACCAYLPRDFKASRINLLLGIKQCHWNIGTMLEPFDDPFHDPVECQQAVQKRYHILILVVKKCIVVVV